MVEALFFVMGLSSERAFVAIAGKGSAHSSGKNSMALFL